MKYGYQPYVWGKCKILPGGREHSKPQIICTVCFCMSGTQSQITVTDIQDTRQCDWKWREAIDNSSGLTGDSFNGVNTHIFK